MAGNFRRNTPRSTEGRLVTDGIIGISSPVSYLDDSHDLISRHDDGWSQTARFAEASGFVDKLMGYSGCYRGDEASALSTSRKASSKTSSSIAKSHLGSDGVHASSERAEHKQRRSRSTNPGDECQKKSAECNIKGSAEDSNYNASGQEAEGSLLKHKHTFPGKVGHSHREEAKTGKGSSVEKESCARNITVSCVASSIPTNAESVQDDDQCCASGCEAAGAACGISFFAASDESERNCIGDFESPPSPSSKLSDGAEVPAALEPPEHCNDNPLKPVFRPFYSLNEGRQEIARRLHGEISSFMESNDSEANTSRILRNQIVSRVRKAVRSCWENCTVEIYGSFSTNLFLPHSDVDLVVMNPGYSTQQTLSNLQKLKRQLRAMSWCKDVRSIDKTSVPVIKLEANLSHLFEEDRLALAMGLHERLGSRSPLATLTPDSIDALLQHLEWAAPRKDAGDSKTGGMLVVEGGTISVDITFCSNALKKTLHQNGIMYSPIENRDFIKQQLARYPAIRPLVLVLKHFLFENGLNDAYKGGLSSHALILLLISFFNTTDSESRSGIENSSPRSSTEGNSDIPDDSRLGEWLLRLLEWFSRFPFETVGIPVGKRGEFIALNTVGQYQLYFCACMGRFSTAAAVRDWLRRYFGPEWDQSPSPFLQSPASGEACASSGSCAGNSGGAGGGGVGVAGTRIADEPPSQLHIEDMATPNVNVARSSYRWHEVQEMLKNAHKVLEARCTAEAASATFTPMSIYLGFPLRPSEGGSASPDSSETSRSSLSEDLATAACAEAALPKESLLATALGKHPTTL